MRPSQLPAVAAALFLVAACGGAGAGARPASPTPASAEAAGPAAVRARVVVSLDTWTDVTARGTGDKARSACARALADEVDLLRRAGLAPRVTRDCEIAPLPAPPERHVPGVRLVVVDERPGGVRITDVTRLASVEECEPIRRRLAARRADNAARGDDGARQWLTDERARAIAERDAACAPPAGEACRSALVRVKILDDKLAEAEEVPRAAPIQCVAEPRSPR